MTGFAAPASSCTALASSLRRQKPTPSASATTLASRSISALIETAATSPRARGVMVIDLYPLQEVEVRNRFPAVYQWVADRVKPERDQNNRKVYRDSWWIFGEPRRELRPALQKLDRYIATVETSKHRYFQF